MAYLSSKKANTLAYGDVLVRQEDGETKYYVVRYESRSGKFILVIQVVPDMNISQIFEPDGAVKENNIGWLSVRPYLEIWKIGEGNHHLTVIGLS